MLFVYAVIIYSV